MDGLVLVSKKNVPLCIYGYYGFTQNPKGEPNDNEQPLNKLLEEMCASEGPFINLCLGAPTDWPPIIIG